MSVVVMKSWREGLEKVALSMLQMELLNMSLSASKKNVDSLLDDEEVRIEVEDDILAKKFVEEADKLGVNCVIE